MKECGKFRDEMPSRYWYLLFWHNGMILVHKLLAERDYVTFGYLLRQIRLSVGACLCNFPPRFWFCKSHNGFWFAESQSASYNPADRILQDLTKYVTRVSLSGSRYGQIRKTMYYREHVGLLNLESMVFTRTWLRYVQVFAIVNPSVSRLCVKFFAPYSTG